MGLRHRADEKKCGLLFDDPEFPDFAERLEEYCGDNDNDHGFKLEDRELLSSRITELDEADFAEVLLSEIWTRFPRQCERLKLPAPKGSAVQDEAPGEEITKHATAKQIADHFGWPVGRVRTELSKGYWGPLGRKGAKGRPDKPFWTVNKSPLGQGANTQFLWVTELVVPCLKKILEQ